MKYHSPRPPIDSFPTKTSITFDGRFICISAIARIQHLDRTQLSRIFKGERVPSIEQAQKIAGCLGMGLEYFLEALERHRELRLKIAKELVDNHYDRVIREDTEDLKKLRMGEIPIPRTPGTRLAS